jgi:hypothetical protein
MKWKPWLYSLAAAGIGGAANALGAIAIMPDTFNFSHQGLMNIGKIALAGAWYPVFTLLKQSPLPTDTVTTTATVTATKTTTNEEPSKNVQN